ncbi:MAG TPA: translation initiation factor IF-2 [Candidatus Saccharimonadales bacterium]|nr:translation initiation factor IF-2 [Candidatus Saccharimonadales bacterium]
MARTIEIEDLITVGTLAEKLQLPAPRLISELMKNGVMATINERIDFDTAQIIVGELGLDVELAKKAIETVVPSSREKKKTPKDNAVQRPPVVAVMGHVDHGKTSLLDAIREAQVAKVEAGGITQHISAYQIQHNDRAITFLDTPGHEAFAAIREHGAHLTDIAIIVIAADDGIKPQTIEAIRFARKADVKIIVAINKIDKEGADPNRIKQQLSEQGLLVEEWGGDTVVVEVSAKTKQGIDQLLDMILLVADVEGLRAVATGPASGLIIEAHLEQGRGPVANALIEEGTLRQGNFVVSGTTYAKVRTLTDVEGRELQQATPSTPVIITGFKTLPEFGEEFSVVTTEKEARILTEQQRLNKKTSGAFSDVNSSELIRIINRSNQIQELNVIVRADVQGSITSVVDSLKALDTDEVAVRVVSFGVGNITENDIYTASTAGAIIYGFNILIPTNIKRLAARDKVDIRVYRVIYELIDDVRVELSKLLAPEIKEIELGRLVVRGVFKTTKSEIICGGEVTKGKLQVPAMAHVLRGDEHLAEVEVTNLKRGPQDVKEVLEGEMCGVSLHTLAKLELQEGDRIEFFTRETISRSL